MGLKETALSMFIRETPFSHLIPVTGDNDMVLGITISDELGLVISYHDTDDNRDERKKCCFRHATIELVETAQFLLTDSNAGDQGWHLLRAILDYRELARPAMKLDEITPAEGLH